MFNFKKHDTQPAHMVYLIEPGAHTGLFGGVALEPFGFSLAEVNHAMPDLQHTPETLGQLSRRESRELALGVFSSRVKEVTKQALRERQEYIEKRDQRRRDTDI